MTYIDTNAKSYGDALFMLSEELSTTERIREELSEVTEIFTKNPDYLKLLDSPALSREERTALIGTAFSPFDVNLVNLLKILAERRLSHLIFKISDAYCNAYDASRGIERVEAISAIPLSGAQTQRLCEKLSAATGKNIIISNTVDSSLLGGIKLRYMGKQIDGTLRSRLETIERSLMQEKIN